MSTSVAKAAGDTIAAAERNALRFDAIVKTRAAKGGEAFSAYTTDASGIVMPTVVVQSGTQWFKANSDGVNIALGFAQVVGLAYTSCSGAGGDFTVILPGSQITSEFFPSMSGGTAGLNAFTSITAGGMSAFDVGNTVAWKLLGSFENSTTFNFYDTENNSIGASAGSPGVYLTSGEALSRGQIVTMNTAGKMVKVDANDLARIYLFNPSSIFVVTHNVSATDKTVRCMGAGGKALVLREGGGSYTIGNPVYISNTAGEGTETEYAGPYTIMLGIAISTTQVFMMPGYAKQGPKMRIQSVIAGENWSFLALLYMKKSDQQYYNADADVAESGILEWPAFALGTHTGGAGSTQLVVMPYSTLRFPIGYGAGDRLFPSGTAGALVGNTPASYDTFWRIVGVMETTNSLRFEPQQMEFLPTGIQEKGYVSVGGYAQTGQLVEVSTGVNFKKIMVNAPSSITLTSTATQYAGTPTANNITRFGFRFFVAESANPGNQQTWWAGTYQTVGN